MPQRQWRSFWSAGAMCAGPCWFASSRVSSGSPPTLLTTTSSGRLLSASARAVLSPLPLHANGSASFGCSGCCCCWSASFSSVQPGGIFSCLSTANGFQVRWLLVLHLLALPWVSSLVSPPRSTTFYPRAGFALPLGQQRK